MRIKNHFIELLYSNVTQIKNNIFPLIGTSLALFGASKHLKSEVYYVFAFGVALFFLHSILKWKNTFCTFDEGVMTYQTGAFAKDVHQIPYQSIKPLHTETTFLRNVFGLQKVTFEMIGKESISLTIRHRELNAIRQLVFKEEQPLLKPVKKEKRMNLKRYTFAEYVLLTFSSAKRLLVGFTAVISTVSLLNQVYFEKKTNEKNVFKTVSEAEWTGGAWMQLLFVLLSLILLTLVVSFVLSVFHHSTIRISKKGNTWSVKTGVFSIKERSVDEKNIRNFVVEGPFLYQLFGYVRIVLENVGVENRFDERMVIQPIIRKKDVESFLTSEIPFLKRGGQLIRSTGTKHSILLSILSCVKWFIFIETVTLTGQFYLNLHFFTYLQFANLLLGLIAVGYVVDSKETKIEIREKIVSFTTNTFFFKKTIIVEKRYVEAIGVRSTILKRKLNVEDLNISLYTERSSETYRLINLSKSMNEKVVATYSTER